MSRHHDLNPLQRQAFQELILAQMGLRLAGRDLPKLDRLIAHRVKARSLNNPDEYFRLLQNEGSAGQSAEWARLAGELTVGESFFFRDKGQFALLRLRILPELIARAAPTRTLRLWSAGCSSGEEPFSLAILLDELLPRPEDWQLVILGTDLNSEALAKARRARYSSWSFRQVEPALRDRYFERVGSEWEVRERFRRWVTFQPGNLVNGREGGGATEMDLIVCRNVFIYFGQATVAAVLSRFEQALRPGGYLLTGHGELYGCPTGGLQTCSFPESTIYRRRESAAPEPLVPVTFSPAPAAGHRPAARPPASHVSRRVHSQAATAPSAAAGPPIDPIAEAERHLAGGNYAAVVANLQKLTVAGKDRVKILTLLAKAQANLGQYDEAIRCCRTALTLDNLAPETHYLLAHLVEGQGRHGEAKAIFRQVLYLDPGHPAAYLELGALEERAGDLARAQQMRSSALAILKALPPQTIIAAYAPMSAGELVPHVQAMLPSVAPAGASSRPLREFFPSPHK